jgi:CubicO group peptidase (beta-lactamase class C family)
MDERFLAEVVDETAARLGVAGAQVAFFDGSRIFEAATGVANADTGEAVTTDTLFQIGSTTKLYAAALNLQLMDGWRIDLDEPVVSYLPDLCLADADTTRTVTLRHLHSMSSGMDNGPYTDHGRGDDCLARYVASLADVPPMAPPGVMFGYSNASTCVAGRVAETLTGLAWEDALRERFLGPAGLGSTMSLFEDLVYRRVAVGHARANGGWTVTRPWRLPRAMSPAGSTLCATAADLVHFGCVMLREGRAEDGTQVLSPSAVEIMRTPVIETPTKLLAQAWCVGTYRKDWGGHQLYGHSGTNASSSSMLLWSPEDNVAIASVANVPPLGYPFAYAVFAEVLREARGFEAPRQPEPDPAIAVDADRYTGRYAAYGVEYVVEAAGGGLALTIHADRRADSEPPRSLLRPLAPDRFLPADVTISGGRGWDVAFAGADTDGLATHFVNGVMVARRVPEAPKS